MIVLQMATGPTFPNKLASSPEATIGRYADEMCVCAEEKFEKSERFSV